MNWGLLYGVPIFLSMKLNDILDLEIEKLSFGGAGIARHDGIVVFVTGAAPGDRLKAKVTKVKKRFIEAICVEVTQAGNSRRETPCKIANDCGGCQWQHISYEEQLAQKKLILQEQISRSKVFESHTVKDLLFDKEFRYRNRIQVRSNGTSVGFFGKSSNSIIPTSDCMIAEEDLTACFSDLPSQVQNGKLTKFEIYRNLDNHVRVISNRSHGSQDGFSQVNQSMNEQMLSWVDTKFKDLNPNSFVDLYAGNGNFARMLSNNSEVSELTAVELSSAAVKLGKTLDKSNSIQWKIGKVEKVLPKLNLEAENLVLLDPPRVGCDPKVIECLAEAPIKDLLYISCNPSTFVRDINLLAEKRGLELIDMQALDMFPQTYHIELMAHFKLKAL